MNRTEEEVKLFEQFIENSINKELVLASTGNKKFTYHIGHKIYKTYVNGQPTEKNGWLSCKKGYEYYLSL